MFFTYFLVTRVERWLPANVFDKRRSHRLASFAFNEEGGWGGGKLLKLILFEELLPHHNGAHKWLPWRAQCYQSILLSGYESGKQLLLPSKPLESFNWETKSSWPEGLKNPFKNPRTAKASFSRKSRRSMATIKSKILRLFTPPRAIMVQRSQSRFSPYFRIK